MNKEEFNKLSELERDCLEYAIGDFWSDHNFRERIEDLLQNIESCIFHGARPTGMDSLPDFAEELQSVCNDAQRKWKHYAQKALQEFHEYDKLEKEGKAE